MRQLGIPSVLDSLIQQALLQQLAPIFNPTFSDHSYGFRPGRSAHDAVIAAQRYVANGQQVYQACKGMLRNLLLIVEYS